MANYNCVEPAKANGVDHYLVQASAIDQITFPAVNSCFAIAFVLSNGQLVGGHVPTLWDAAHCKMAFESRAYAPSDPSGSAMSWCLATILDGMNRLRAGSTVSLAITLGDTDWKDLWNAVVGQAGYPREIRYRKHSRSRNLIVNGSARAIAVQSDVGGAYAVVAAAARTFADGRINPHAIDV